MKISLVITATINMASKYLEQQVRFFCRNQWSKTRSKP